MEFFTTKLKIYGSYDVLSTTIKKFNFYRFQRKMLAVYLHHDSSVLTNVFCTQVTILCYFETFLCCNLGFSFVSLHRQQMKFTYELELSTNI